jgi:methylenetetrahydrofolate dehydrogenase (NADP+)/methenyltetrahydrofolate cyclohydrolase
MGAEIGAEVIHQVFEMTINERELLAIIDEYNNNPDVQGIIVQIPLPKHLRKEHILEAIHPDKDVDGLTSRNIKALFDASNDLEHKVRTGHIPATARGIITLLEHYHSDIEGRRVVIVGRSNIVGKPTALAFLQRNATVTLAHKHTKNLAALTRQAEILVVAIGNAEFITKEYVSPGQVVIDVGINRSAEGKIVGDVKFDEVEPIVKAITPVPGGVGPMTVISLFQNLIDAYTIRT